MDDIKEYIELQKTVVVSRCLELGDTPPYEQGLIDAYDEILEHFRP